MAAFASSRRDLLEEDELELFEQHIFALYNDPVYQARREAIALVAMLNQGFTGSQVSLGPS